jgi:hypothetical protein
VHSLEIIIYVVMKMHGKHSMKNVYMFHFDIKILVVCDIVGLMNIDRVL